MREIHWNAVHHLPWLEYRHTLPDGRICIRLQTGRGDFDQVTLQTVSPDGSYAVGKGEKDGKEEILCMSKKRVFSLSSVLAEGDKVQKVDFVYENLILVQVENVKGQVRSLCYKICF